MNSLLSGCILGSSYTSLKVEALFRRVDNALLGELCCVGLDISLLRECWILLIE